MRGAIEKEEGRGQKAEGKVEVIRYKEEDRTILESSLFKTRNSEFEFHPPLIFLFKLTGLVYAFPEQAGIPDTDMTEI
jgi:hypothetical protein